MTLEFNEYLEQIIIDAGGLGKFQLLFSVFILGGQLPNVLSLHMMMFGNAVPNWKCNWYFDPVQVYVTNNDQGNNPPQENYTSSDKLHYDVLTRNYSKSLSKWKICKLPDSNISCRSKWYDPSMVTVVSEWDLVCARDWIGPFMTTVQMSGLLVGAIIAGLISDKYGRKNSFALCQFLLFTANGLSVFSNSWQMFCILRFFIGAGSGFSYTLSHPYLVEFSPPKFRMILCAIPTIGAYSMMFAGICWMLPNWKNIQIVISLTAFPFMVISISNILPESFRWLASTGKLKEAHKVVTKMSKCNGKDPPSYEEFKENIDTSVKKAVLQNKATLMDILKDKRLLKYTIIFSFIWPIGAYGMYAVMFMIDQLPGTMYLNFFFQGLFEMSRFIMSYFSNRFGRKKASIGLFCLCSISAATSGILQLLRVTDVGPLVTILSLLARCSVAAGWFISSVLTFEVYPTVVRNTGYGFASSLCGVGGILAPFGALMNKKLPGITFVTLAFLVLVSSLLITLLPETKDRALEDTLETPIKPKDSPEIKIKPKDLVKLPFNLFVQKVQYKSIE